MSKKELKSKSRAGILPTARGVLCYLGTQELSISGAEIARYLEISRPAVSHLIKQGDIYSKDKVNNLISSLRPLFLVFVKLPAHRAGHASHEPIKDNLAEVIG